MTALVSPVRTVLRLGVLGPVELHGPQGPVDLGTPKQRALLVALALGDGRPVSVDAVIDLLWGDDAPAGAMATLQAYVSGLRKALEPERAKRAPASVLVTVAPGYALRLAPDASDADRFASTVRTLHPRLDLPLLGPSPLAAAELEDAVTRLDEALASWRGTPYAELGDAAVAVAARSRLEELRTVALEDRAHALLALGHAVTTAAELEALTAAHPLRERLWALRALALVRSGRQADALDVIGQVRRVLDDELGLELGSELRTLQQQVLRQDPALDWSAPAAAAPSDPAPPAPPDARTEQFPGPSPGQQRDAADGTLLTADTGAPVVGRDAEVAALETALGEALAGRTAFAVVTGEPGIGKSRLCAVLADRALARGARVLVGRCSQDDGAPPLWPWTTVLDRLGVDLTAELAGDLGGPAAEFRVWERAVRRLQDAAAAEPVVVLLDDLHWADTASLRVLRLLAETSDQDRLLVVATWRDQPRPEGDLAEAAEALARRHATRVALGGLDDAAVAGLVGSLTSGGVSPADVHTLRSRTGGNPFFVVEYARLAGGSDLRRLLREDDPPTAVREVLDRRLARLPEATVAALRVAAVVGREFDLDTLARTTGSDEDDLLDVVEPALAAGLVREDGIDRFTFAHALVRDAIYAATSPSRRARQHARVAAALQDQPARRTELARHWLAAGPAHAGRAWRAAAEAAEVALASHAYVEAAEVLTAALAALAQDPDASGRDRYHLLMRRVVAYRWAAMWPELVATVEEAVEVAEALGDSLLRAEAAIATTQGALWQSGAHGEVHEQVVDALRRSLEDLPPGDSALRCRCMLSLSNELYYATGFAERRALVDEALAMARRLDDPGLVMDACQIGFMSLWTPATTEERLGLADESLAIARATGNEQAVVVSASLRAVVLGELGRPAEMWAAVDAARAEAERLGIAYGVLVLDNLVLPWYAMAGDFERCASLIAGLERVVARASLKHADDAMAGAAITMAIWQDRAAESAEVLATVEGGPLPIASTVAFCRWRGGQEQEACDYLASHDLRLEQEDWFSLLNWCNAAAMALFAEDPELGATTYRLLAPHAGKACTAGSGNASGPVDAYLAMAAAAVGETATAARHADRAAALAQEWRIPLFSRWFGEQRDRFRF